MNFIQTVVRDNAIGFPQDRASRDWTSGYYYNDAKYRLLETQIYLRGLSENKCVEDLKNIDLKKEFQIKESIETALKVAQTAYSLLKQGIRM